MIVNSMETNCCCSKKQKSIGVDFFNKNVDIKFSAHDAFLE